MLSGRLSLRADTGATATEYCLLATFIAVAIVGTVTLLGTQLVGLFSAVFPAL
jgi:Flp pilus assembly pilin Flp